MTASSNTFRWVIGSMAVAGLMLVFLFQHLNVAAYVTGEGRTIESFLINRTIRFLLNDFFAIVLIYALFPYRNYLVFSLWIQLAGVIIILIPYFLLKIKFPLYNGPLLSFLHRLIMNPTILLLLIPAFYYQRYVEQGKPEKL